MTQAQIDEATRAQVAAGAKSTDRANQLPGETSSEANARITAAYKEMTAKPVLSQEQIDAGAQVKFVRTGAGGVGENMVIVPIAYDGPPIKVTEFTPGVIPANVTRTTGSSVGFNPDQIDLNDPTLRSAITDKGDMNLFDFKRQLRQDNRWQYTGAAKEEVSNAALKVLQDFGFMG